ncbi:MAG: hypothetical protein GY719_25805 [bacterium]|nr:hypothetical protein [bacterium]
MSDCGPPCERLKSPKQKEYHRLRQKGLSQRRAYLRAGYKGAPESADANAARLEATPSYREVLAWHAVHGAVEEPLQNPLVRLNGTSVYLPESFLSDPVRREAVDNAVRDLDYRYGLDTELVAARAIEGELLRRIGTAESGATWSKLLREAGRIGGELEGIEADLRAAASDPGKLQEVGQRRNELLMSLRSKLLPLVRDGVGEEAQRNEIRRHGRYLAELKRTRAQIEERPTRRELQAVLAYVEEKLSGILARHLPAEVLPVAQAELAEVLLPRRPEVLA